jgi:glutamine amidotransferase
VRAHPVLEGLPPSPDFYFVHAYHVRCFDPGDVLATTPYCGGFTSAVARDNVIGVQFHPEKSQGCGRTLLQNFLEWQC